MAPLTPPLLPLPHNWVDSVEVTRAWPTHVHTARDGSEQRRSLTLGAREAFRYNLTAAASRQAGALLAFLTATGSAALDATGQADRDARRSALRVRVPRWPDGVVLDAAAAEGATTLSVMDDATLRAFVPGGDVVLWYPERDLQVVTLAGDAITADTLTLAAPLALAGAPSWRPGTVVAPLLTAHVEPVTDVDRITPRMAAVALRVTVADDLAGDGGDTDGAAAVPVLASLAVMPPTAFSLFAGQQATIIAVGRDAAGAVVPAPVGLAWTNTDPARVRLRLADHTGRVAYVEGRNVAGSAPLTVTVTDPDSGLSVDVPIAHAAAADAPPDAP